MFCLRDLTICIVIFATGIVSTDLNQLNVDGVNREKEKSILPVSGIETLRLKEKQFPILRREKRQLIFPIATLLQCSFAVASPVQLKEYNIYVNQGWQLNFILPFNITQFASVFLFGSPIINGRSREKREYIHHGEYEEKLDPEPIDASTFGDITSKQMYFMIEKYLDSQGYNGSGCVLHSICQHSAAPFHQDNDLLHEILHFVLTPSEHATPDDLSIFSNNKTNINKFDQKYTMFENPTELKQYLEAEVMGQQNEYCDMLYKFCPRSPLDKISKVIYDNSDEFSE